MLFPHQYSQRRSPITPTSLSVATSTHHHSTHTPLYHPLPNIHLSPKKRQKTEHHLDYTEIPSTLDCPPLDYPTAMPHTVSCARLLAPQINVQRASEPASPVTIASTISNNSTPSASPSRVTIISDTPSHDFPLFDECVQLSENHSKQTLRRTCIANTSNPSQKRGQFGSSYSDAADMTWPHNLHTTQPVDFQKGTLDQIQNILTAPKMCSHSLTKGQSMLKQQHRNSNSVEEPDLRSPPRNEINLLKSTPQYSDSCEEVVRNILYTSSAIRSSPTAPKLTRTVSDALQDELFNPGIAPGTTLARHDYQSEANRISQSQISNLFKQAQSQHAMARTSPVRKPPVTRERSPFRANSPFHPARTQEPTQSSTRATTYLPIGGFQTAQSQRERHVERDAESLKLPMATEYQEMEQMPKTMSPKDAYIEYHEPEGPLQGCLLSGSQQDEGYSQNSTANGDALSSNGGYHDDDTRTETNFSSMATSRRDSDTVMDYATPIFATKPSQQYPQQHLAPYGWSTEISSHDETSNDDYEKMHSPKVQRSEDTNINSGAYSCTVHGCYQRFSTASKMSKHRREAHRHGSAMNRDMTVRWQHQGPHQCSRINPTTGKSCNTIFSRPYDLTRHEDTIHNTARQKVRCEICNDEKTFSRHDALTRHKKVKHGIDK